jgi:hypothetical protein
MYPRFVAKLSCNIWYTWFYAEEHLSVLVKPHNTQLEAELDAAERNVKLYSGMIKK